MRNVDRHHFSAPYSILHFTPTQVFTCNTNRGILSLYRQGLSVKERAEARAGRGMEWEV